MNLWVKLVTIISVLSIFHTSYAYSDECESVHKWGIDNLIDDINQINNIVIDYDTGISSALIKPDKVHGTFWLKNSCLSYLTSALEREGFSKKSKGKKKVIYSH